MTTKVGTRYYSTTCTAEVIVVKAGQRETVLTCGGAPMVGDPGSAGPAVPADAQGVQVGKRYENEEVGIEVLATKAGGGPLEADGSPMVLKDPKRLPASD